MNLLTLRADELGPDLAAISYIRGAWVERVRTVEKDNTMMKKAILAWSIGAISLTGTAFAQPSATVTLRSGERLSANIVDLGGSGYTVRVDGKERQLGTNEVAAIDFTGGSVSNADWDKLSGSGQVLMLKNGEAISGQLIDIGGTSPLRITFRTASGEREFSSNDIARIVMARPDNAGSSNTAAAPTPPSGTDTQGVTVSSKQQWSPTGIVVRRGDWVTFSTSGEVRIGGEGNPTAGPDGVNSSTRAPDAPVATAAAGALIGRIGTGAPFLIGSQTRVQMKEAGQLSLGVNDGHLQDNDGSFQVQVSREGGSIRRR